MESQPQADNAAQANTDEDLRAYCRPLPSYMEITGLDHDKLDIRMSMLPDHKILYTKAVGKSPFMPFPQERFNKTLADHLIPMPQPLTPEQRAAVEKELRKGNKTWNSHLDDLRLGGESLYRVDGWSYFIMSKYYVFITSLFSGEGHMM